MAENNSSAPLKTAEGAAHQLLIALRTIAAYPVTNLLMNMDAANMQRIAARALEAHAAPAAEPLPLLVRDIARDIGISSLDACQALKGLGNFSVNSAVTADMARKLRECFPEATEDSSAGDMAEVQAEPVAVPDGWKLVKQERLDVIDKYAVDPSVKCYLGRNYYDESKVHENWEACQSHLSFVKDEIDAIRGGLDDEDLQEAMATAPQDQSADALTRAAGVSDEDITQMIAVKSALESIASGMTTTNSDRLYDRSIRPRKMTIRDAVEIASYKVKVVEKLIDRLNSAPGPQAQPADALDADGEAFRTAAKLGLTLRFYGGCAQSSKPRTPSAYAEVVGPDPAASMREAVQRVKTTIDAAMAAAQEGGNAAKEA